MPADLPAIEDLAAVLDAVTAVGPDGVLMSAGQARLLAAVEGRPLPALTVRGDVTNLYRSPNAPRATSSTMPPCGRSVSMPRRC